MTTLTVNTTHDYTGESLTNITQINYTGAATATFGSNQFGPGLISNSVLIVGDASANTLVVNLSAAGSFSAAGWTFSAWTAADSIQLNGTSGADTITGSSAADTIAGGDGADTIDGGNGDDILVVNPGDFDGGELIDGGGGTDTLMVGGWR